MESSPPSGGLVEQYGGRDADARERRDVSELFSFRYVPEPTCDTLLNSLVLRTG